MADYQTKVEDKQHEGTVADKSKCSNCNAEVVTGTKFCPECGNKIEPPKPKFCVNCGTPLKDGTRFCPNCGQGVSA